MGDCSPEEMLFFPIIPPSACYMTSSCIHIYFLSNTPSNFVTYLLRFISLPFAVALVCKKQLSVFPPPTFFIHQLCCPSHFGEFSFTPTLTTPSINWLNTMRSFCLLHTNRNSVQTLEPLTLLFFFDSRQAYIPK